MNDKETRTLDISRLELRDNSNENFIGQISGYVVVFNQPSDNLSGFVEYIEPRAFDGIDLSNIVALYAHDVASVLGRTSANTLQLSIDDIGLRFVLNLPDTTVGHDVYTNVKAGNLRGMSFGFTVAQDSWARSPDGTPQRTITQIGNFYEISVVALPAYPETSIMVTRAISKINHSDYKAKVLAILKTYE